MRISALAAAVALVPVLAVTGAGAAAAAPAACPDKMIFEVGGHRDPDATVYDPSNARLPAGVGFTKVHYSASIAPYPGDTISLDDSVAEGIANLDTAVRRFHASCPDSHLTLSGYSQGAIVAGDELNVLSGENAIPHHLISGVLYGDPRRPGAGGGPGGIETNLPTFIPGMTMRGPRGFGDLEVRNICNKNDGICHSDNVINNLLCFANGIVGYFAGDHGYAIEPNAVSGGGDMLIQQPPRIPGCGPPLPIPARTLREMYEGDLPAARHAVRETRTRLLPLLGSEARGRMEEFPWLSVTG